MNHLSQLQDIFGVDGVFTGRHFAILPIAGGVTFHRLILGNNATNGGENLLHRWVLLGILVTHLTGPSLIPRKPLSTQSGTIWREGKTNHKQLPAGVNFHLILATGAPEFIAHVEVVNGRVV
ncbi:uncharacterized protein METZ01_LOCUS485797, partial [marine metagenome]